MGTPLKCFTCGGEGHFSRECPSNARGHNTATGNANGVVAPTAPRFWAPRRVPDDTEERQFLREMMLETKQLDALRKEQEDKRRFEDQVRIETARHAEATKAELMALLGKQFLSCKEEARREEIRTPVGFTPRRRDARWEEELDREVEDLDDEIRRLSALRDRKRRGKAPVSDGVRFRQPSFGIPSGSVENNRCRVESSDQGEVHTKTKIAAGSGPEGLIQFVLDQRKELSSMKPEELKRICSKEGVHYCTKLPTIERIITTRVKCAYEGFVFLPSTSAPTSPDEDLPGS
ncbi:hypothetical protein CBR_g44322 [Chara braunii]|uniref:CCHC-type domain-containing protein n=1 Tax=Chara braunii TaxID=69332 RepID=A0A388K324_CHABU|nr:hypothetical protein CBR_g44322 [Chara braunii]|eukprot:GBG64437.1 hypothetical protein CBR_g44322 [Chara braunii]